MNILASPLPRAVDISGASVPIRSGYRTGIQVSRLAETGVPGAVAAAAILRLYFETPPADGRAALAAALRFHRLGADADETPSRGPRLLDWDHDAGMILADFRREYAIDLADAATRMHWWVFMAYFRNLSNTSETKTAMYYRSGAKPRRLAGAEAKRHAEMRLAYALPPRTASEALSREAERWGDDG